MSDVLSPDEAPVDDAAAALAERTCNSCGRELKTRTARISHEKSHGIDHERAPASDGPKARRAKRGGDNIEQRFAATLGTVGLGLHMLGQGADAAVIADNAGAMARAAANVAAENETMRKLLELVSGGSAWGEFLMVWLPVVIAIAANHSLVPERFVPPNVRGRTSPPAKAASPQAPPAGGVEPTVNSDGSVTMFGVTLSAEQLAEASKAFGIPLPADLLGPTEVTIHDAVTDAA